MTYTTVLSIGKAMIYDRKREAGIRNPPPVRLVDAMRQESEGQSTPTTGGRVFTTKPARQTSAVQGGLR